MKKCMMFFLMVVPSLSLVGMDVQLGLTKQLGEEECKLPGILDFSFLDEHDQPNIKAAKVDGVTSKKTAIFEYCQQKYERILRKIKDYAGKRVSVTSTYHACIKILSPKAVLVIIKELDALLKSMQFFCKVSDPVNAWGCEKQFYKLEASIVQMLYDIRDIMGWRLIQLVNGLKLQNPVNNVVSQNSMIKNPKAQQQLFLKWYSFLSKNQIRLS